MSIFLYNLFRVWIGELKMKKKYTIMLYVIALLLSFVIILGGTYAYFAVTLNTAGNDKKLNIVTEDLGSIKWVGTKVYTSDSLLPGEIGLQTFTIEKNSATGKGIYEIDLNGIVDEAFNNDIEITLYKTTDTTKNNVSVTSGNTSMTGTGTLNVAKEDTLNITGTPEKIYGPKIFKTKNPIILEQKDFDNSTFQKTTYYLVYHYKNNGNQNNQQGKSFSGEISVKLILEKGSQEETSTNAVEYITKLAQTDTTNLIRDYPDIDNNLRYIGKNPNNYVWFDEQVYQYDTYSLMYDGEYYGVVENTTLEECQNAITDQGLDGDGSAECKKEHSKGDKILWRIIGAMNKVDNGTGIKETRIKLIRNDAIGYYSWDTSESSVNSGTGVNEWSQADLMKLLNPGYEGESVGGSLYWNSGSGKCYNAPNNVTIDCDFSTTGLGKSLQNLIDNTVWHLGMVDDDYINNDHFNVHTFYGYENSARTGKICTSGSNCNDAVERTTTWTGKVGLMYTSDYGYATSGGSSNSWNSCVETSFNNWFVNDITECSLNDYLLPTNYSYTLTPYAATSSASDVFTIINSQSTLLSLGDYDTSSGAGIYPVVYLKSAVTLVSGDGSTSNPFILSGK